MCSPYWTLTKNGSLTANLTFHYADVSPGLDVPTTANENVFASFKYNGLLLTAGGSREMPRPTLYHQRRHQLSDWTPANPPPRGGPTNPTPTHADADSNADATAPSQLPTPDTTPTPTHDTNVPSPRC